MILQTPCVIVTMNAESDAHYNEVSTFLNRFCCVCGIVAGILRNTCYGVLVKAPHTFFVDTVV